MRQNFDLFPPDQIVGIFRGFREGGLEFHADLALPYRSDFHTIPMQGEFGFDTWEKDSASSCPPGARLSIAPRVLACNTFRNVASGGMTQENTKEVYSLDGAMLTVTITLPGTAAMPAGGQTRTLVYNKKS